ncbi:MAG TPA: Uma2 family endonuclease [Candidatus Binatia bacterium]|nr:Uma2 family endonuclease [Candidatus Binatia bacterium]
MATDLKRKLVYDDYARIPDDGKRHEILNGELYVTPAPSPLHQRASKRLQRKLEDYFEARGLAEVFNAPIDMILGPHDVAQPDILVVTDPDQISGRGIEGAPLLVVEVLSPSTRRHDREVKLRRYAALAIPHYWILDPEEKRIACHRREGDAYQLILAAAGDAQLIHPDWPDLAIPLADLWR